MGTKDIISKTEYPNTITSLTQDMIQLGIEDGDTIIVHTSLSKIGWIVGGAVALIDALMKVVTSEGNIVMPTQTANNTDPAEWMNPPVPKEWHQLIRDNYPPYRPELSPSSFMGVVPETFRRYPKAFRSNHPTVSFAAWGKNASELINDHSLESGLGNGSPLEKLYYRNAKILLIGVDHDSNTSLHLAEDRAKFPSKKYTYQSTAILKDEERVRVEWEELDLETDDFIRIGREFEDSLEETSNLVIKGKIGMADSMLINQRELVDFAEKWMSKNRK